MATDIKSLILVVDDLAKNLQVLGNILSGQGYRIAVATNGKQALTIIEKTLPDLILLDIMMPEMDGFEVCRKIKANDLARHIPILFISAKSDVESKVEGLRIGGADYITKPFQVEEVLARVSTHLKLKLAIEKINNYNRNLEKMLEQRTRELIVSERNAAFSLFSQGIVHNLKNPLSAISGGAQIIKMSRSVIETELAKLNNPTLLWEKISSNWKYLDMVENGSSRMLEMINSLMAKSRSDKNAEIQTVNMNNLINQEIEFLNADIRFKSYTEKTILIGPEEILIDIVPGEFSQIFQNLVQNSLDAMHEQEYQAMTFCSGIDGDSAWFKITDNGPGISKEIQDKIFDPFFTTKEKTNSNGSNPKGTGLGLHMCQQMMNTYGGKIELESVPQKGTCFCLYFPLSKTK